MYESKSFFVYSGKRKKSHILLHSILPEWIQLNDSALEIAVNLTSGKPVDEISKNLAEKYGIDPENAKNDVLYVQGQLKRKRFLAKTPPLKRVPRLNSIYFHLTGRCNLACPHCYIAKSSHSIKDLQTSLALRLIDEVAEAGGKSITLSGGEPLLHPDIKTIIEHAEQKLQALILTNGTLIDKNWASFLGDKNIYIQISMDGSTGKTHDSIRGRGNFDKSVSAVKYLQDAGLGSRIQFSTTIMGQNVHDLKNIIHLAENLKVPKVRFLPLRRAGRAMEKWNLISGMDLKAYEDFFYYIQNLQRSRECKIEMTCGLTGFMLHISKSLTDDNLWCPIGKTLILDNNGDTYPCVLMMEEEFRLGNAYSDSLSSIIKSEKMKMVCKALTERRNRIEKCSGCNWKNFCQSGCMGQALDHKGTIWDTDDYCDYRLKAYRKAFKKILSK